MEVEGRGFHGICPVGHHYASHAWLRGANVVDQRGKLGPVQGGHGSRLCIQYVTAQPGVGREGAGVSVQ